MVTPPKEVVSLDRLEREGFRIPAGDTDQRELLTGLLKSAVAFVSRQISLPLVDVTETRYMPAAVGDDPLRFRALAVKSVDSVKYWSPAGALRAKPDGTFATADLGRFVSIERDNALYPPVGGWPAVLDGSPFEVEITRGFEITEQSQDLRSAVILCVRQLHDGWPEIRPTAAFYALIAPWRRYDYD